MPRTEAEIKAYKKAWAEANRERLREYHKQYQADHRAEIAEVKRRYADERREEIATYQKQYRAENKERLSEFNKQYKKLNPGKNREWYARNREDVLRRQKEKRELAPDEFRARRRKHYHENREVILEKFREDYQKNPVKYRAKTHRRRVLKSANGGTYTAEDVKRLLIVQNGLCAGCKKDIRKCYTIDHVEPLVRGGSNGPENLQLLCRSCNCSKNDLPPEVWAARLGKLFV